MGHGRTAFIYSAQGTQWAGMGRELLARNATFEQTLRRCDRAIRRHFDWSLLEEMASDPPHWRLHDDSRYIQPAVTALQIALTEALADMGLRPDGVGSLSMGEAAAMHAAGAIGLDDAMAIACSVARLGETALRPGLMAMLCTTPQVCRELIGTAAAVVAIELGPNRTVVSGEQAAVREVLASARHDGLVGVPLPIVQAYHSPDVAGLGEAFKQRLAGLRQGRARIDTYSSVSAGLKARPDLEHWWAVCSQPARFHTMVLNMFRAGFRHFVEVGPQPMLGTVIEEAAAGIGLAIEVRTAMQRATPPAEHLLQLAQLFSAENIEGMP